MVSVILRYRDTICVYEHGQYFAIYADGTKVPIRSKLDILPVNPRRSYKPKVKKRGKRS